MNWKTGRHTTGPAAHSAPTRPELEVSFLYDAAWAQIYTERMDIESRKRVDADLLATEAVATARIEGVELSHEKVMSELLKLTGVSKTSNADPRHKTMARFVLDVHRNYDKPITLKRLFSWHTGIMRVCGKDWEVGMLRSDRGFYTRFLPLDLSSQLPTASELPRLADAFIDAFNKRGSHNSLHYSPVTVAAETHMYFMKIQPFRNGNEMIARALVNMTVSRRLKCASNIKLSNEIFESGRVYQKTIGHEITTQTMTHTRHYFSKMGVEAAQRTLDVLKASAHRRGIRGRMQRYGLGRFAGGTVRQRAA